MDTDWKTELNQNAQQVGLDPKVALAAVKMEKPGVPHREARHKLILSMCAWCKRFMAPSATGGAEIPFGQEVSEDEQKHIRQGFGISHGICKNCNEAMEAELAGLRRAESHSYCSFKEWLTKKGVR